MMLLTVIITLVAFVLMGIEALVSRSHERSLRAQGAVEPRDDIYGVMQWMYPASFLAMAAEGVLRGGATRGVVIAGAAVFLAAKAIKYWAMATLGGRWSFRVLVLPGAPLVTGGPYAHMRHPNYLGVMGELAGFAMLAGAPIAGMVAAAVFAAILRRRIAVEERALQLR
jgi:methyltransferase